MTQADERLMAEVLLRSGHEVTTEQLGRWRDHRLLPTPVRTARGRQGITSDYYPDGSAERVGDILEMLNISPNVKLAEIPILLFCLDRNVEIEEVRRAFAEAYRETDAVLPDNFDSADAERIGEGLQAKATRNVLGKFIKHALETKVLRRTETTGEFLYSLWARLYGGVPNTEAENEFFTKFGLTNAADLEIARTGLALLDIRSYENRLDIVDPERLRRLQTDLWDIVEVTTYLIPIWSTHDPLTVLLELRKKPGMTGFTAIISMLAIERMHNIFDFMRPRMNEVLSGLRSGKSVPEAFAS